MSAKTKRAFHEYVKLVEPIDDVRHVVAFEDAGPEFFTYITSRDDEVCYTIFRAENELRRRFQELEIDFHIVFMEGRPLEHLVAPLPPLAYSK